ncbi:tetratricopeptide repeat protein [Amaricoccus sp.]|uniref:tetratricopeptide repeat protein n=1 Tax=Amaricoccus sp. TaxID=1872485 RepID=UPI001B6F1259|nr:tetratricopeptide repeat protein [Amaricoccus sp.]MBP7001563.1 tetratricopeptide repeat protein [Amaricoccus sp.]
MPLRRARILAAVATVTALLAAPPQAFAAAGLSGSYLAATQADMSNDYVSAADYYGRALALDPGNLGLMQNAAVARVAENDVAGATPLAKELLEKAPGSPIALLVVLADDLANGDFDAAEAALGKTGPDANPLFVGLLSGWLAVGKDDFTEAQARFDAMNQNEALAAYGQYHKALALALAGDFVSAEAIFAGGANGPLHLGRAAIAAHAQTLAQIDRVDDAVAVIDEALAEGYPSTALIELRDQLAAGEEVPFTQITRAQDGAAEVFLTMAEGLGSADSDRLAIVYARLAKHIRPDLIEASLVAAEALARQGRFDLATAALAEVPADSPWHVTAEIRRAETQRAAGDAAAGIATLQALAASHGDSLEVQAALADQLRMAERYADAAAAYSAAIGIVGTPQPPHWGLYYSRAISYERAGDWTKAETDFREALALQPGQPSVQNYLGYSLVEQGRNLDEALALIEQAVAGQPDDGYITDSLGWVLYRLGRYEEALPHMLRAVELEPVDPIINDHLGDVLWKVGRKREAEFQWRRALSFGPAPDLDMDRLRTKLAVGLEAAGPDKQAAPPPPPPANDDPQDG